ncbi:MAG: nucleoside-diphosphate-sugar epimerase [Mariniblastus sp.]|jgi:nucleoside-diphosphate-sugar epimerase
MTKVAVTGVTGFVGRDLATQLIENGNQLRCWRRPESDVTKLGPCAQNIAWVDGELADGASANELVAGCDAVVHAGLWRATESFQDNEMDVVKYAKINVIGTLELIEAAIAADVKRFVFISTCAVHDHILDDRALDEAHPLWPNSHYGAHKAAIEKFVHSYGLGKGFSICALRPSGIYGVMNPVEKSKWFPLIQAVADGKDVEVTRGGKEVHVADVAKAIRLLIETDCDVAGQAYSCFDRYISQFDVATIAKRICGSPSQIEGGPMTPKYQIDASKIKSFGMKFGGESLLEKTIKRLLDV